MVIVLILALSDAFIPYNDDEFMHYRPLLCGLFPGNRLLTLLEGCGWYDLRLPGLPWTLPLRTFDYVGSFHSLTYLPLYLLWPHPLSARLHGLLYLLLQAWLLGRAFRWRTLHVFLALCAFFPYLFQHLADTGPVAFQTTGILALLLLFRRWLRRPTVGLDLGIALILALGFWAKIIYVVLLPGIALLLLGCMTELPRQALWALRHRLIAHGCLIVCVAGALCAWVLLAHAPDDASVRPFLDQMLQRGERRSVLGALESPQSVELLVYTLNPLGATHRIFTVRTMAALGTLYDLLVFLAPVLLCALAAIAAPSRWRKMLLPFACFTAFYVTMAALLTVRLAWAMHHAVLAYPFLLLGTAASLRLVAAPVRNWAGLGVRWLTAAACVLFVFCNAVAYAMLPLQKIRTPHNDPSKETVNRILADPALAHGAYYVLAGWGMYMLQGLYGHPDQGAFYFGSLWEDRQLDPVRKLAREHGRSLLFVYNRDNKDVDPAFLRRRFTLHRCAGLPEESAWEMWMEDRALAERCGR